ncbi:unnamed protein product, partial [Lasius platythorax]
TCSFNGRGRTRSTDS